MRHIRFSGFLGSAVLLAASAFVSLPPAHAQGQNKEPVARTSGAWGCPSGWSSTKNNKTDLSMCFPQSSLAPDIYPKKDKDSCAEGYIEEKNVWCTTKGAKDANAAAKKKADAERKKAESKSASSGSSSSSSDTPAPRQAPNSSVAKASRLDRCPLGHFSISDMTGCTAMFSPAPKVRTNTGGCSAGEIDEWGLYCTADATVITRTQAEAAAVRDFNQIYAANELTVPTQGDDSSNYPSMVAAYGPKGGAQANSGGSATPAAPASTQDKNCNNGSNDGAAVGGLIGGAVAGSEGAAIGSTLGGLGKKKKKKGC